MRECVLRFLKGFVTFHAFCFSALPYLYLFTTQVGVKISDIMGLLWASFMLNLGLLNGFVILALYYRYFFLWILLVSLYHPP